VANPVEGSQKGDGTKGLLRCNVPGHSSLVQYRRIVFGLRFVVWRRWDRMEWGAPLPSGLWRVAGRNEPRGVSRSASSSRRAKRLSQCKRRRTRSRPPAALQSGWNSERAAGAPAVGRAGEALSLLADESRAFVRMAKTKGMKHGYLYLALQWEQLAREIERGGSDPA
jgi:hypothetical protein